MILFERFDIVLNENLKISRGISMLSREYDENKNAVWWVHL
jgi:hypothetical protein